MGSDGGSAGWRHSPARAGPRPHPRTIADAPAPSGAILHHRLAVTDIDNPAFDQPEALLAALDKVSALPPEYGMAMVSGTRNERARHVQR